MSTDYQTYSHNHAYIPQQTTMAYAQPMPQMVPMGSSPMFQPMQMTGPVPHMYLPPVMPQMNCGLGALSLGPLPSGSVPQPIQLPMMSTHSSVDSLSSLPSDLSLTANLSSMYTNELSAPFCQVGSMESYHSIQRTPSPVMGMMPSYSPQPYGTMMPTMISFIPANPLPATLVSNVTVTNCSGSVEDPMLPETCTDPNLLGYRGNSFPRSRSPSLSRGRSLSDYSVCSDSERDYFAESTATEPSKRDLVNRAFAKLQRMFGMNFDQNGNRGENILRMKVKTRTALEHIVPFIEFCQQENLIVSVSCPISTKKGRQQVRGFLAYLQMKDAKDADRVEELIQQYNASNGSPFPTWHRNPKSTWKTRA